MTAPENLTCREFVEWVTDYFEAKLPEFAAEDV